MSASELAPGVTLIRGFVSAEALRILSLIRDTSKISPFRRLMTPGGRYMSVEMTNCGSCGWVSDSRGYRYESLDPMTGKPWPSLPDWLSELARESGRRARFPEFEPDVCLINKYAIGSSMGMHRDADERDFSKPIVSFSLGLPIRFRVGGRARTGKTLGIDLAHGDVLVLGGAARRAFHGVGKLGVGCHPITGDLRFNLTFRQAL